MSEVKKMTEIRKLVETVVCSIVDETTRVKITQEETDKGLLFEIAVAEDDVGKLIGKSGRIAKALRTIAKATGAKHGVRVLINVMNKPI
jgi:uncharacterized protein